MIEIVALLACGILIGLSVFQFLLIAGVPIARFAWGGKYTVLPSRLRIASMSSLLLYGLFAVMILSKAQLLNVIGNEMFINTGMWLCTGYFFLGVVMNAISRSKPERLTMTPVALMLAVAFLFVALI